MKYSESPETEVDPTCIMESLGIPYDTLSHKVIGCAIEVHRNLGPGLLESAYQHCLAHELSLNKIAFKKEAALPLSYKGTWIDCGYRLDFIVEDRLILELKSVRSLEPIHEAQLITYLKLSGIHAGLLLNFNVKLIRDGIKRLVH